MTADIRWTPDDARRLRHDIRGCMHGLMLVISALETPMTDADRLEFLGDLVNTATRMEELMAKLENAPDFFESDER